jgi:hypothetical protein
MDTHRAFVLTKTSDRVIEIPGVVTQSHPAHRDETVSSLPSPRSAAARAQVLVTASFSSRDDVEMPVSDAPLSPREAYRTRAKSNGVLNSGMAVRPAELNEEHSSLMDSTLLGSVVRASFILNAIPFAGPFTASLCARVKRQLYLQDVLVLIFFAAVCIVCGMPSGNDAATTDYIRSIRASPTIESSFIPVVCITFGVAMANLVSSLMRMSRNRWQRAPRSLFMSWRHTAATMLVESIFFAILIADASMVWVWCFETGAIDFDMSKVPTCSHVRLVWPLRYAEWAVTTAYMTEALGGATGATKRDILIGCVLTFLSMFMGLGAEVYPVGSAGNILFLMAAVITAGGPARILYIAAGNLRTRTKARPVAARRHIIAVAVGTLITLLAFPVVFVLSQFGVMSLATELVAWSLIECLSKAALLSLCTSVAELSVMEKLLFERDAGMIFPTLANISSASMEVVTVSDIVEESIIGLQTLASSTGIKFDFKDHMHGVSYAIVHASAFDVVVNSLLSLALEHSQFRRSITVDVRGYETLSAARVKERWVQTRILNEGNEISLDGLGLDDLVLPELALGPGSKAALKRLQREVAHAEASATHGRPSDVRETLLCDRLRWCQQIIMPCGGLVGIRSTTNGTEWFIDVRASAQVPTGPYVRSSAVSSVRSSLSSTPELPGSLGSIDCPGTSDSVYPSKN